MQYHQTGHIDPWKVATTMTAAAVTHKLAHGIEHKLAHAAHPSQLFTMVVKNQQFRGFMK
jgi:hypothetical protein